MTLRQLGSGKTEYKYDSPSVSMLETFSNPSPARDYTITHATTEFTSLCPVTGQPDYAQLLIEYVPDSLCVETKSLKLYLFAYRNHGAFMEAITNKITDDLITCLSPRYLEVTATFSPRGGIGTSVVCSYRVEHTKV